MRPDSADAHNNLGAALQGESKLEEAIACYRQAVELKPEFAEAHNNLGGALRELDKPEEAIACCRRVLELKPDFAEAHNALGVVLHGQGNLDDAAACYRRALELKPDYAEARRNALFLLQYRPGVTLAELAAAHAEYDRRHAVPLRAAWKAHKTCPILIAACAWVFSRRISAATLSASFLVSVLANLDPAQCEAVCYSDR